MLMMIDGDDGGDGDGDGDDGVVDYVAGDVAENRTQKSVEDCYSLKNHQKALRPA